MEKIKLRKKLNQKKKDKNEPKDEQKNTFINKEILIIEKNLII